MLSLPSSLSQPIHAVVGQASENILQLPCANQQDSMHAVNYYGHANGKGNV
jgi:hypothetical protein